MTQTKTPKALTIAGSDSGAGAGIQADLKTFCALDVYGTTAITAITAQNTLGVSRVIALPPEMVAAQIDAIVADIGTDAAKTGMLYSAEIIEAVAERVTLHRLEKLVVDPVMVAKGGQPLLQEDAVQALKSKLLPLALIVTPNIPEAEKLTGRAIASDQDIEEAARALRELGPRYVLVKGGHRSGEPVDTLFDGREFRHLHGPRLDTPNTHGTGCTLSAAIAAYLAGGRSVDDAAALAKEYVTDAIRHSLSIGAGHGPVNQFFRFPDHGNQPMRRVESL